MVNNTRRLDDAVVFAAKIQEITHACPDMFVNVRTDTFFANVPNALDETLIAVSYINHGGCGFFAALCVTRAEDITAIVRHVPLPLNVMYA